MINFPDGALLEIYTDLTAKMFDNSLTDHEVLLFVVVMDELGKRGYVSEDGLDWVVKYSWN